MADKWAILSALAAGFTAVFLFLGWAGSKLVALTRSFEKFHANLEAVRLVAEQADEKAEYAKSACAEHSKQLAILSDRDARSPTGRVHRVAT